MEQSPFVGYVKIAVFALLAGIMLLSVWQASKTEDKVVALETTISEQGEQINELAREVGATNREVNQAVGANKAILKMLASGGFKTREGGTGGDVEIDLDDDNADWGWKRNKALDAKADPSRPVGTPGRYKNFLRPDPDPIKFPEGVSHDATLTFPWSSEPAGFNYIIETYATLSDQVQVYNQSYPALRHRKRPSAFNQAPSLCWRIEIDPEYKEFTLFFRKDAFWHRPLGDLRKYPHLKGRHPVTAHDLKFSIDIITDPNTGKGAASLRSYYDQLESIEVLDDYTCVIRWKKKQFTNITWSVNPYILARFVYAYDEDGKEYPKEVVGQAFTDHWYDKLRLGPVGSGPYRFVKYEPGKYVRLERWDRWYGFKDEPLYPIKTIHYKIFEETESAMNWLRTNETDIGGLTSSRYRSWVLEDKDPKSPFKDGRIKVYKARRTAYMFFAWKNSDPLFTDKRVRQAMTYACNRQEICRDIWLGRYEPMAAPIYPESEEASPGLSPYPFDLDKARSLLDAAGWKLNPQTGIREKTIAGEVVRFEFKLHWPGPSNDFQASLDHYKNDLLKIGIKMEPLSVQWATYQQEQRERKYRAFSMLWATPGWEHDFRQIWHSDGIQDPGSSNFVEYSNKELDALQDKLRETLDQKERIRIVRRIGAILHEDQPYTFFGWSYSFRGYWSHVKGVEENPYFIRPLIRFFPMWAER